jgi:hypothetical protein
MSNNHWLRKKTVDPVLKGLFRATQGGDYTAGLALLDRLSELGHVVFADDLRHVVTTQQGWSDTYRARFICWRTTDFMCGTVHLVRCAACARQMVWAESSGSPPGWLLRRDGGGEALFCPECHNSFGKAFDR